MQALLAVLATLAGMANPMQSAANAGLYKGVAHPAIAGLLIYTVGMLAMLALTPFVGGSVKEAFVNLRTVPMPWWVWVGGLCNALFVMAAVMGTSQLGAATITVLTSCTAIVVSIIFDHFGLFGLPVQPATALRILGGAMAVVGIVLVSRF